MSVLTAGAPPRGRQRYQLESGLERLTPAERAERGRQARAEVPRESHAVFDPGPDRPDPIGLLAADASSVNGARPRPRYGRHHWLDHARGPARKG